MQSNGREDPALTATVTRRVPLWYADGADPAFDRPPHVRAASGVVGYGRELAVVQDDALFLAFADPATGLCRGVPLPCEDGVRLFDAGRRNKMRKPDLEAVIRLDDLLVGFGSGSAAGRDRLILARGDFTRWFDGSELYAALAANQAFAGSELNVEGVAVVGDAIRLFNRGNGRQIGEIMPGDATCDVDLGAFLGWLDGGPVPAIRDIVRWDLGFMDGVRLTFTDATATGEGGVLFLAAAEASPNAVDDGVVVGAAVGRLGDGGWCRITEDGAPLLDKVEGIALDPADPGRAWVVVDRDDPDLPAALLELRLGGF